MYKILIALATLTTLASCSFDPIQPPAPAKQMTPDAMIQKETMPKDTMMKDDKMMSGSWTKAEMEAMEKDHMMMATGAMMQKEIPKMEATMKPHGYMGYSPDLVASALKD